MQSFETWLGQSILEQQQLASRLQAETGVDVSAYCMMYIVI